MTPAFALSADGVDATAVIADRLLSLRVTDEAGLVADALDIELDNRGDVIAPPRRGAELSLALGLRETGLAALGRFSVTALSGGGPDRRMTITARAADLAGAIRDPRTFAWDGVSLGDVAREIAARHGLEARVAPVFDAPAIAHLDQNEESDLNLLSRLAEEAGALASVKSGALILLEAGAGRTADGAALPAFAPALSSVSEWRWRVEDRRAYAAVRCFWSDRRGAERRAVDVGEAGAVFEMRRTFDSEAEALRAAEAKRRQLRRAARTLSLSLAGFAPDAAADAPLSLSGFDASADGRWRITRATHRLDDAGLRTSIEAEQADQEDAE